MLGCTAANLSRFLDLVANTGAALPVGSVAYPMAYQLGLPSECGVFFPSSDHVTTCMRAIARFIVFMMTPGSAALPGLAEMLSYIEPYYHPSNFGGWSVRLAQFARSLCSSFARRVAAERKLRNRLAEPGHEATPREQELEAVMLSDKDVDKFLEIMLPLLFKSLYSKSGRVGKAFLSQHVAERVANEVSGQHSSLSLKTLAQIKPEAVFPELLESIFPDLETVLQTHRTQAALEVLGYTCRPLLWRQHYAGGAEHLLALLSLTLPGIDPNDLVKTHATLKFYSYVLMAVPMHDESNLKEHGELTETELKIKQSTAGFADWGIQLLQRVLVLYSLCVEGQTGKQTSMESIIHMPVQQLCSLLFMQADEETYGILLSHFFSFVTNNYLANAVKELGKLCCGVAKGSPEKALKLFVSHYHMVLLEEVPEGSEGLFQAPLRSSRGNTPIVRTKLQLQSLSTNELEWALVMLAQVCKGSGGALLGHKQAISEILKCVLESKVVKETQKLFTASVKLLRTVLKTLTSIYLLEYRSWATEVDTSRVHWSSWGDNPDGEELRPLWHYPSDDELKWAIELIELYGRGALDAVIEIREEILVVEAEKTAKESAEEGGSAPSVGFHLPTSLRKRLWCELELLDFVQKGARDILVKDSVASDDEWSTPSPSWKFYEEERCKLPRLPSIGRAGVTERAEELGLSFSRMRVAREVLNVAQVLVEVECDDTRLLTAVTTFVHTFVNYPLGNAISLLLRKKGLASEANFTGDHMQGKSSEVRYMRLARASQFYKHRHIESSFRVELSPLHFELIHLLLQLSVNAYSSVRYAAQEVLHVTFRYFFLPSRICGPLVIDYLGNPSSPPEHITGAVYLLHNVLFLRSILSDWTLLQKLFFSVLDRRPSSTSSIQGRLSSLMDAIASVFVRVGIVYRVAGTEVERLKGPWPELALAVSPKDTVRLQEKSQSNLALYQKLVQDLITCYTSGMSWVNSLKCASMLTLLVRDDVDLPTGYIGGGFNMLLSDIGMLRMTAMVCLTKVLSATKVERPRGIVTIDGDVPGREHIVQRMTKERARELALEHLTDDEEWENASFQDKNFFGWNGVSKNAKSYLPLSQEERTEWRARVLAVPIHQEAVRLAGNMDFWREFVAKAVAEQRAEFSTRTATFFKSLFQVTGVELIQRLSETLGSLCENYSEQSEQALACHILAGSGRGCKHWPYEDVEVVFTQFIVPKMMAAIENATPECFNIWLSALNFVVYDRDIRRLHWLHDALLGASLNQEESSLLQSRRIKACVAVISEYSWRGMCFGEQLISRLIDSTGLLIDRKVVREATANMMAMVLGASFEGCRDPDTGIPTLQGEMKLVASQVQLVDAMVSLLDNTNAKITQFFQKVAALSLQQRNEAKEGDPTPSPNWQEEVRDGVIALKKERAAGRKLVLYWIVYTCRIGGAKVLTEYIDRLVPHLFVMRDDDDPELLDLAVAAIGYVANSPMPRERVVSLLPVCYDLLKSPTTDWHAKVSILPFLQVVVFKNILDLGRQELEQLIQVLLLALVDRQLEVRTAASTTLSGVLKFVSDESYLAELRGRFYRMAETSLPSKRQFSAALLGPQRNATIEALLQRHGGVLGMTALVGMHPYGIPSWLPELLVDLVMHINDPSPIKVCFPSPSCSCKSAASLSLLSTAHLSVADLQPGNGAEGLPRVLASSPGCMGR